MFEPKHLIGANEMYSTVEADGFCLGQKKKKKPAGMKNNFSFHSKLAFSKLIEIDNVDPLR